ncbi:MAG TPA: DUF488 domain-containing protein [Stellaceae bacterium]|nr:DUF488 domain-containing protein [Stellaceae bacterium]
MADVAVEVLTIGHSTLPYERFIALLREASVTAVADVRTAPYSRHFPHFNRDTLRHELRYDNIAYVFLGEELGGRPQDKCFFHDGVADYEKMARTEEFAKGLGRVVEGAKKYRLAMMCSEHDPLDCHRCLLVGRALHQRGVTVRHILSSGKIIDHSAIEAKLLELMGKDDADLFEPIEERLAVAYRDRAFKVAFTERKTDAEKLVDVE